MKAAFWFLEATKVRAAAPGRVILVRSHNWFDNTIAMSHDVNGVRDAYRTIYSHLRNGSDNDCQAAWTGPCRC